MYYNPSVYCRGHQVCVNQEVRWWTSQNLTPRYFSSSKKSFQEKTAKSFFTVLDQWHLATDQKLVLTINCMPLWIKASVEYLHSSLRSLGISYYHCRPFDRGGFHTLGTFAVVRIQVGLFLAPIDLVSSHLILSSPSVFAFILRHHTSAWRT